jgi:hypothetical protein
LEPVAESKRATIKADSLGESKDGEEDDVLVGTLDGDFTLDDDFGADVSEMSGWDGMR